MALVTEPWPASVRTALITKFAAAAAAAHCREIDKGPTVEISQRGVASVGVCAPLPRLPCFLLCVAQSGRASVRYGFVLVSQELLPWVGRHDAKERSGVACELVNICLSSG